MSLFAPFAQAVNSVALMKERNLKQIDIVRLAEPYCKENNTRLGRNDISQYVAGKSEPGQHKLYILGKALNVI